MLVGPSMSKTVSRRLFLSALAVGVPLTGFPRSMRASTLEPETSASLTEGSRVLSFAHTHTGECLKVEYFDGGGYVPDALSTVNHFLRDFRTGAVHPIDEDLLDLLHNLRGLTATSKPFQVISGYRSPQTNEMLRQLSEGVAAGSLHMKGQAIDIRLSDIPLGTLRKAALSVKRGGVGFYPHSDFVHIDTGRVRAW